jgi:hypothetical protein
MVTLRVDRDGLRPPERHEQHEKRPHRVKVRERVQRQSVLVFRGFIAQFICGESVCELVNREQHKQNRGNRKKSDYNRDYVRVPREIAEQQRNRPIKH